MMAARPPAAWMARSSAFASCPERWQWMATAQPPAASRFTMASPIRRAPPVTRAVRIPTSAHKSVRRTVGSATRAEVPALGNLSGPGSSNAGRCGLERQMHGTLAKIQIEQEIRERPSREAAEQAVRTLIRWAGEDPDREGLADTPARVTRAYAEWFEGYEQDPAEILQRTFKEVGGYDDIVVLRDIPFESCCEHHMAAIRGPSVSVTYRETGSSASRSWPGWSTHSRTASRSRSG